MKNKLTLFIAFALCAVSHQAIAQKTYKWVDEKGVVNYGPVPPSPDKAAKINTAPALTLRDNCTGRNCYDQEADRRASYQDRAQRNQDEQRARQEQIAEAQEQRRKQLTAECERNRGTDCKNPATLRDMENMNKPYTRRW